MLSLSRSAPQNIVLCLSVPLPSLFVFAFPGFLPQSPWQSLYCPGSSSSCISFLFLKIVKIFAQGGKKQAFWITVSCMGHWYVGLRTQSCKLFCLLRFLGRDTLLQWMWFPTQALWEKLTIQFLGIWGWDQAEPSTTGWWR